MVARLEAAWELYNGLAAVAMSSWAGGALAALHFAGVEGETVLCPSNTFMATPLAAINAGASVEFVDCNREDLCMSFKDFEAKAEQAQAEGRVPGPHRRAPRVRGRGDRPLLLRERDLPDRGLRPRPRRRVERPPSRAHTATPASTRCTRPRRSRPARAACSSRTGPRSSSTRARSATTASPSYEVHGLNFRMNEFTAALGLVEIERLPEIVAWKNEVASAAARPGQPQPARAARREWSRASTSTSCSSGSSARPVASTTSPATGSWATTWSCRTPTGSRATIRAFRCITGRSEGE